MPAWMRPARLLGRVHPALDAAVDEDARRLVGRPVWLRSWTPLLAVLVLVAWAFAAHAFSSPVGEPTALGPTALTIDFLVVESIALLIAATILGILSPSLGLLFVLLFSVVDLGAAALRGQLTPLPGAIAGRLLVDMLVYVLVVEVPLRARTFATIDRAGRTGSGIALRSMVVAGIIGGVLGWGWCEAAAWLIRPAFLWADLSYPSLGAETQLQQSALLVGVVVGVLSGVAAGWRVVRPAVPARRAAATLRRRELPAVWVVPRAALVTFLLAGLISQPFDAAILFAGFAAGPVIAAMVRRSGWLRPLSGLALPLRFGLALAASFLISLGVMALSYAPVLGSEFFVVVVAIAAGAVVVPVLLNGVPPRVTARAGPVVTVGAALFVAFALWAVPGEARADNCSGLADCFDAVVVAALAAAAAPMLFAGALAGSQPPDEEPPPPPERPEPYEEPPPPPERPEPAEEPPPPPEYPPDYPPPPPERPPEVPPPPPERPEPYDEPPPPPDYPPDYPPPPPERPPDVPPPPPDYPPDYPPPPPERPPDVPPPPPERPEPYEEPPAPPARP